MQGSPDVHDVGVEATGGPRTTRMDLLASGDIQAGPRGSLGRSLAFFAVFERSASILGPLVWAGILLLPFPEDVRFSSAMSAMGAMVVCGACLM